MNEEEQSANTQQPNPEVTPPLVDSRPPVSNEPLAPQQPVYQPVSPSQPPTGAKKSRLGLWIGIAVAAVVLLILLAAAYILAKGSADTKAQAYRRDMSAYLSDVKTKLNDATSLTDAQKNVSGLSEPKLSGAFLSSVSSDYSSAANTQNNFASEMKKIKQSLAEYAAVDTFTNDYQKLISDVRQVSTSMVGSNRSTVSNGITKLISLLQNGKTLVDKANLPSELADSKKNVSAALSDEVMYMKKMSAAFEAGDSAAYTDAYNQFTAAARTESSNLLPIRTYAYKLDIKRVDLLKSVEDLQKKFGSTGSV